MPTAPTINSSPRCRRQASPIRIRAGWSRPGRPSAPWPARARNWPPSSTASKTQSQAAGRQRRPVHRNRGQHLLSGRAGRRAGAPERALAFARAVTGALPGVLASRVTTGNIAGVVVAHAVGARGRDVRRGVRAQSSAACSRAKPAWAAHSASPGPVALAHPEEQGLIQSLAVVVDTMVICTATAFIVLISGVTLLSMAVGAQWRRPGGARPLRVCPLPDSPPSSPAPLHASCGLPRRPRRSWRRPGSSESSPIVCHGRGRPAAACATIIAL